MPKHSPIRYSEIGCRIPKKYFWVIGWGESDVGIETGSYDAALHMAGIENYNIMLYTSVLPPEAVELRHLPDIHHGSVLEGIIAVQHTDKPGTRITAGVLLAKVFRNSDNSHLGGFACEYAGEGSLEEAEANRRDLIITAPFDGTVMTRAAEPGEVVIAGTAVLTLLNLSKVYLRGFVPEGQIGKVKIGQAARVYLDSNQQKPIDAYVSRIDPQATFTPENTYFRDDRVKQVVGVKLQLKGGFGFAKPGMPVDGEILVRGDTWPKVSRK